ncbi:MAG: phosphotransferase, partial [Deltaproteobacteria bacterium]|nr:phosphotransferase [Deltaproteobacteria bacterium]
MKNGATVSANEVNAMLAPWKLRVVKDCQIATKGVENTNILLPGRTWVLRLYRSLTHAEAEREALVLEHLGARGFPVSRVLLTYNGARIADVAGRPAAVLAFLPGDDLEDRILPVPMAHDLGALIGRMDVALAGLSSVGHAHAHTPPPHDLTHFAETRQRLSQCRRRNRDGRQPMNIGAAIPWALVDRCLDQLEAEARSWGSLPRQLIHGDLSAQNLLADGARVTGVLDFGDVAVGARVADI